MGGMIPSSETSCASAGDLLHESRRRFAESLKRIDAETERDICRRALLNICGGDEAEVDRLIEQAAGQMLSEQG